ncbi:MAG: PIN domain-containing protein [Bacteroidota bacterium]
MGELLAGFKLGNREKANQEELRLFLQEPQVLFLTINAQTAASYAEIYQELRQNGTPIPTNDMWIAAMARQLNLAVFSFDKHFAKVKGLKLLGLEG